MIWTQVQVTLPPNQKVQTRLARISDYYTIRQLWYQHNFEENEEWLEGCGATRQALNVDRYVSLLWDHDSKLVIFSTEGINFGYGFLTVGYHGLMIYQAYVQPEFYDSFPNLRWGISVGQLCGVIPTEFSFDCNKLNIRLKTGDERNFVAVSEDTAINRLQEQCRKYLAEDVDMLEKLLHSAVEGERRPDNTSTENQLHASAGTVSRRSIESVEQLISKIRRDG